MKKILLGLLISVSASAQISDPDLNAAYNLAKKGQYEAATIRLYNLSKNPRYDTQRSRIKYLMGVLLSEMGLHQVAAFQFVDVVRANNPAYMKQALQKLSIAADALNDDTLLNFAIDKVSIQDFPKKYQDMLSYRFGEFHYRKSDWAKAIDSFSRVPQRSPYYSKAKYMEGLANVENKTLPAALRAFSALLTYKENSGPTNTSRVAAMMAMARTYYQGNRWDLASDLYRQIPKDTHLWHDSLFENSWAYLRAAQFSNVLSNLHTLHSAYYQDFFLPESVLLRGIVYLFLCRYKELEKTLALFEKLYQPVLDSLNQYTEQIDDEYTYFGDIEKVILNFEVLRSNKKARQNFKIPFIIARDIINDGKFEHVHRYLTKLRAEDALIMKKEGKWRTSPLGAYARELLKERMDTTKKIAGSIIRARMITMKQSLEDNFEQYNYARFDMLDSMKDEVKKKLMGLSQSRQVADRSRQFYVQNGYQFWPFKSEYWLDEIGNYFYLGTQTCQ